VQRLSDAAPVEFLLTITVKGITFSAFMRRKDLLEAYRIGEFCCR
jgi:hypothetical protein